MQAHRDLLGLVARVRRERDGNREQMAHLVHLGGEVPLHGPLLEVMYKPHLIIK